MDSHVLITIAFHRFPLALCQHFNFKYNTLILLFLPFFSPPCIVCVLWCVCVLWLVCWIVGLFVSALICTCCLSRAFVFMRTKKREKLGVTWLASYTHPCTCLLLACSQLMLITMLISVSQPPRRLSSGSLTSGSENEGEHEPSPPVARRGRRSAIYETKVRPGGAR